MCEEQNTPRKSTKGFNPAPEGIGAEMLLKVEWEIMKIFGRVDFLPLPHFKENLIIVLFDKWKIEVYRQGSNCTSTIFHGPQLPFFIKVTFCIMEKNIKR